MRMSLVVSERLGGSPREKGSLKKGLGVMLLHVTWSGEDPGNRSTHYQVLRLQVFRLPGGLNKNASQALNPHPVSSGWGFFNGAMRALGFWRRRHIIPGPNAVLDPHRLFFSSSFFRSLGRCRFLFRLWGRRRFLNSFRLFRSHKVAGAQGRRDDDRASCKSDFEVEFLFQFFQLAHDYHSVMRV